jgi:lysophospholipase L1-like esterase
MIVHKNKNHIREIIIVLGISLIGCFVAGEIFIRFFKKNEIEMIAASANPRLVYELNEHYRGINALRMRDKDFRAEDLKGRYLIAVIGDSHSYSIKVKNVEDAFPARIEQYLGRSRPEANVRVLNFGVPGYNTAQELEVLQAKVLAFDPQLVILQYHLNDMHLCNYIQPKYKIVNKLIHSSKFLVWFWKKILYSPFGEKYLYDWIGHKFPDALLYEEGLVGTLKSGADEVPTRKRHPPRAKDRVPQAYHYMLGEDNWRKHVHLFAQICQKHNIPVLATGIIGEDERAVFLKEGFAVYSFNDIFKDKDMKDYGYNYTNTVDHFDARGNDVIGQALADYIAVHYNQ